MVVVCVLVVLAVGCSGEDGLDESLADLDTSVTSVTTSSTVEEPAPTTSTTVASSTTLSEQAQAEAEIEEVITAWWTEGNGSPDPEQGLEYLTGQIARRVVESRAREAEEGYFIMTSGGSVIEVTLIEVDIDKGEATAYSCGGFDTSRFDIETLEPLKEPEDPTNQSTSEWTIELTPEGWKITNWYPSYNTGDPVECTIGEG